MRPTPLPNTFLKEGRQPRIYVRNSTPGKTFFQEQLWFEDGIEYRQLDPRHSKLAAALAKGCQQFGIREGSIVLYLGASHGYTPSFVSDMIGTGMLYCVDVAPRVVRDLVFICEARANMVPVLADASDPQRIASRITGADAVFQDIAQRHQVDIFLRNCDLFLRSGGFGMLAVKARSIDVLRRPADIFKEIKKRFESLPGYVLVDYRELDPFERDHAFFVVKKQ